MPATRRAQLVRTGTYMVGGLGVTAATAVICPPVVSAGVAVAAFVGTVGTMLGACHVSPERVGLKHGCWLGAMVGMGVLMSGLTTLGSAALLHGALATTGVMGALALVAMLLPADATLAWRPYINTGILLLLLATLPMLAFPAMHTVACVIDLVGGLALFSASAICDTQDILRSAGQPGYDPMSRSIDVYLTYLNLFVRILEVLELDKQR